MEVQSGRYAGLMALAHEGERGIEFMKSLGDDQRKKAMIADQAAANLFEGLGRRHSLDNYEGYIGK